MLSEMRFLLSFITFSSVFAQSLSANPITNDSDNSSEDIEVLIQSVDKNILNDILVKYDPNVGNSDNEFTSLFSEYVKTQNKFDEKSLAAKEDVKDVMLDRMMPLLKKAFKFIWNAFIAVLDRIWSEFNHMLEQTFNRSLPTSYYMSGKSLAKKLGQTYLCQKALAPLLYDNTETAAHHCSTIFSSLDL